MHSCAEQDAVPSHAMFPIARLAATGLFQTGCLIFHSRGRGFSLSVGGPERLTNACRPGQCRSAKPTGRACRIPCHGPRCFRSTPGSRTPLLRFGNILPLFSFGGQGAQWNGAALPTKFSSVLMWWPMRTGHCSRLAGCLRTLLATLGRTTQLPCSTRFSRAGGCPSARLGMGWVCRITVFVTRRPRARC